MEMASVSYIMDSVWSEGQVVCLVFLEHVRARALEREIEFGERTNEILAYGKIGCTCGDFRPFIREAAIISKFDYEIEAMLLDPYP